MLDGVTQVVAQIHSLLQIACYLPLIITPRSWCDFRTVHGVERASGWDVSVHTAIAAAVSDDLSILYPQLPINDWHKS
jgi:hypothetical protein